MGTEAGKVAAFGHGRAFERLPDVRKTVGWHVVYRQVGIGSNPHADTAWRRTNRSRGALESPHYSRWKAIDYREVSANGTRGLRPTQLPILQCPHAETVSAGEFRLGQPGLRADRLDVHGSGDIIVANREGDFAAGVSNSLLQASDHTAGDSIHRRLAGGLSRDFFL